MSKKVIFLDIDGVICCNNAGKLEESKLSELKRIVQATNAKVVLSTDWRRKAALKQEVVTALRRIGASCIGATPQRAMYQPVRPQEITDWLRTSGRGVMSWVAIDDRDLLNELGGAGLSGHFVRTHPGTGLTPRLADRCIQILSEERSEPPPSARGSSLRSPPRAAYEAEGAETLKSSVEPLRAMNSSLPTPGRTEERWDWRRGFGAAAPPSPAAYGGAVYHHSPPRPASASGGDRGRGVAERSPARPGSAGVRSGLRACCFSAAADAGGPVDFSCAGRGLAATYAGAGGGPYVGGACGVYGPPPTPPRPPTRGRPASAPSKRGHGGGGGGGGGGIGGGYRDGWVDGAAAVSASGLHASSRPQSACPRAHTRYVHAKPWT
eukprot:Transcript_26366.p1 GENE.Transcript_26366~~Transcript_26366.p1  ORF type:complete len:380 (-),score=51.61 Transcript_26366:241-1380(-)